MSRHRATLPSYLNRKIVAWAVAYALAIGLATTLSSPGPAESPHYTEGQQLRHAVVPRIEFKATDKAETELRRDEAFHYEPAVYLANTAFFQKVKDGLDQLMELSADENIVSADQIAKATVDALALRDEVLRELKRINISEQRRIIWDEDVARFVNDRLPDMAVLSKEDYVRENDRSDRAAEIALRKPNGEEFLLADGRGYNLAGDLDRVRRLVTEVAGDFPVAVRKTVIAIVMNSLEVPTYERNEDQTTLRRERARAAVPPVERTYHADTVLFNAGHTLSAVDLDLLEEEDAAYARHLGARNMWLLKFGRLAVMMLFGGAVWAYVLAYNGRIARNPVRGLALTTLLIVSAGAAIYGSENNPQLLYAMATFPTLVTALILAITYDQRFAVAVGAIHAVIVTVCLGLPLSFAIVLLAGVAVAVAQLNEVRTRSKLVVVGLFSGAAMAVACIFASLTGDVLSSETGMQLLRNDAGTAFGSGFSAGVLVQAILPVIERLFQVTTSMRLKELNETSRPLLRQLAEKAPGTYQHSLRIADMAEAAADAIGADGLLCRVGSMYHDIGKVNKPGYFVENQAGGPNRHEKLSPAMSLLIIVGHVKDGVEMGRDGGLPPAIRHFIESHHGTTLVEYFYHAAKQQQKDKPDQDAPSEFTFRYPGPKPQTREAAILMICDGVEGAARSLPEPTPIRLEQLVRSLSNKRLMDGQFDECNLTLEDLHQIEQAITRTVQAIYHGRIAYPSEDEQPQTAASAAS